MSLALLFHYLLLNMFRMLVHPSSGACDLFVAFFHGLYCSGIITPIDGRPVHRLRVDCASDEHLLSVSIPQAV